jgi:hypothetical protein
MCIRELSNRCKDFEAAVMANPDIPHLLWNGSDATLQNGTPMKRDKSGRIAYQKSTFGYKCIARLNQYRTELNARIKDVAGQYTIFISILN